MSYTVKKTFEKENVEMRAAYCATLIEMAKSDERICVLDSDLVGSSGMKPFFKEFPERAIDCGIQENNMIGVAAGLSAAGMVPFAHSFAPFAVRRCLDQIFISCAYAKLNVRILGTDPGITAAYNGGTHMPFEDMAALMAVPEITLVEPTDSVQLRWLLRELKDAWGVYYIRMARKLQTGVFEEGSRFELGKAAVLRDGTDVCIVASGIMVKEALAAAESLAGQGISAAVLNTFTWKPIDDAALAAYSAKCGCFVTAENHNVVGGLGSAVASSLAKSLPAPVETVGVQDRFGQVGTEAWLRTEYELTDRAIERAAKRAIERKRR